MSKGRKTEIKPNQTFFFCFFFVVVVVVVFLFSFLMVLSNQNRCRRDKTKGFLLRCLKLANMSDVFVRNSYRAALTSALMPIKQYNVC